MTHIAVICEGKTEAGFVRDVLGSYFSLRDISVTPMHINTSPEHSGGSLSGQRVVRSTRTIANRRPRAYITTLFDLYGLPSDFPGVKDSSMRADPLDRAQFIEQCLKDAVITDSWEYPQRLIPYSHTNSRHSCSQMSPCSRNMLRHGLKASISLRKFETASRVRNTSMADTIVIRRLGCNVSWFRSIGKHGMGLHWLQELVSTAFVRNANTSING